jgi:hypothetical protein
MKRVFTSADPVAAGLVESLLESAGIRCLVRNRYLTGAAGELPLNEVWPEVWVLDEADAGPAERLIADNINARASGAPPWTCARCGEVLEAQFGQCWRCGEVRAVSAAPA